MATSTTRAIVNEAYCVPHIAFFPKLLVPASASEVRPSAQLPPTLKGRLTVEIYLPPPLLENEVT